MPYAPSAPSSRKASAGKRCSRSHCAACGFRRSAAKDRIDSRTRVWASLSSTSALRVVGESYRDRREHRPHHPALNGGPERALREPSRDAAGRKDERKIADDADADLDDTKHESLGENAAAMG